MILIFSCNEESQLKEDLNSNKDSGKIKVYLLGTFHFAQTDSTYNVLETKHQSSIEELTQIIASQKPNKVFLERQPEFEYQNKIDTLYTYYRGMKRPLKSRNEIYQVGFRVAKQLNHDSVYLCDHPGRYGSLSDIAAEYAEENNQIDILYRKRYGTVELERDKIDEDSLMKNLSLLDYMRWINSDKVMDASHAGYVSNWPLIGSSDYYNIDDRNTLLGANVITDWYRRNILIYTKMINQVDYENDDAIFLIIGGDHIPIIRDLFESNPYFEVVPTSSWLED